MTRATQAALAGRLRLRRAPLRSVDVRSDTAAFEAVYRDAHQELYRYARSIVRDEHLAEDVLQSVMEKALAALQTEERDFELRPWLFRVTHNEAISRLRRERPTSELPDALPTGARALDDQVDDQSKLDTLWADLQVLPDRQRQSLVLRELSGLSHEEIAAVIESTPRAVKQTIFEARRALVDCEEGRALICDDVQRQLSDGDGRVRRGRRIQAHLRSCRDCRAFDRALHERPHELRALAPVLPAAAAATLFAQLVPGAKLAAGSASAVGTAGAATAGGLATTGGWSLGALGGALATKTAVVAMTAVAAVGATGAVVADRVQGPSETAAPAAGAAAGKSSSGSGGGAGGASGAVATTPAGSDRRAPGAPATTPNAAPKGTTPGSARGQERRAAGQARAAEARAAARDRKADAAGSGNGKSSEKPKGRSGTPDASKRTPSKQQSNPSTKRAPSAANPPSSSKKPSGSSSSPSTGKDSSGTSKAPTTKAPSGSGSTADDTPTDPSGGGSSDSSSTATGTPPERADSGGSQKPQK